MTCASLAPAAGTTMAGLAAYGSVAGGAALAVLVGRRRRGAPAALDVLAELGDDGAEAGNGGATSGADRRPDGR